MHVVGEGRRSTTITHSNLGGHPWPNHINSSLTLENSPSVSLCFKDLLKEWFSLIFYSWRKIKQSVFLCSTAFFKTMAYDLLVKHTTKLSDRTKLFTDQQYRHCWELDRNAVSPLSPRPPESEPAFLQYHWLILCTLWWKIYCSMCGCMCALGHDTKCISLCWLQSKMFQLLDITPQSQL